MADLAHIMHADPDYAWAWHCNLAMPIHDAGMDIEKANEVAGNLMYAFFGVRREGYDPGLLNRT
jgi:hypothetical protein